MFKDKNVLITGGTGSLGKALTKFFVENCKDLKRLIIFSRDEQKQFQMSQEFPESKYPFMRYFIGDVRDIDRLNRAFTGVDYVIHAAAMKHVHIAEYNPDECVKTNINGAQNVILASISNNVKRVVALSTDKACAPINLYGATKLASDKLFVAANNFKGSSDIRLSVVRYGNVMGSNGSVIPFFIKMKTKGFLTITSEEMTRFNITLKRGVECVLHALENAWGGEIFIPKLKSYKILDIANSIGPECEKKIIGIRPGEKIHEEMITESDSFNTYDLGHYYVILPSVPNWSLEDFLNKVKAIKVPPNFTYNSKNNDSWETVESLKKMIENNIL
jgi:UDP-N-acetylglucosamine 4,6-dehydratase/5-epimerase